MTHFLLRKSNLQVNIKVETLDEQVMESIHATMH
jgi:hypothetical protein